MSNLACLIIWSLAWLWHYVAVYEVLFCLPRHSLGVEDNSVCCPYVEDRNYAEGMAHALSLRVEP